MITIIIIIICLILGNNVLWQFIVLMAMNQDSKPLVAKVKLPQKFQMPLFKMWKNKSYNVTVVQ